RKPREAPEFIDQVRLVVEPALLRERRPWHLSIGLVEDLESAAKAVHAGQRLGREAHLLLEEIAEMFAREPRLRREIFNAHASAAGLDAIDGPAHGGVNDRSRFEPREQPALDDAKPRRERWRVQQAFAQRERAVPE